MRQRIRFIFKILGLCFLLLGVSLVWRLPNMAWLIEHNPTNTSFMELHRDKLEQMNRNPDILQIWVDLPGISNQLKKAVLAAEDDTFFDHDGFNWKEIKKAYYKNLKAKKIRRGASTITQQLVKNLYLGPQKNIYRKVKEAVLTFQMERTLSKNRILELYLNLIEWGPGIFGVEAASQYYYHKGARNLSAAEAAHLAALIPNPLKLAQSKNAGLVERRARLIQKRASRQALGPRTETRNVAVTQEEKIKPQTIQEIIDNKEDEKEEEIELKELSELPESDIPEF